MGEPRLFTFRELLKMFPVSERTLRDVIAELGYRRAQGRGRLIFNDEQVAAIEQSIVCTSGPRKSMKEADPGPLVVAPPGTSMRAIRTRETRRLANEVRRSMEKSPEKALGPEVIARAPEHD